MSHQPQGDLERLYEPIWAGGLVAMRWLFALAALVGHGRRVTGIGDVYGAPDMVFTTGWYQLAEYFYLDTTMAYVMWAVGIVGIGMIAWGGKAFRPGMILWFIGSWALIGQEALNVKAYDRLLTWIAIGFFFSAAGERDLTRKYRSPLLRYYLMIVFSAIYGSTGLLKLIYEPAWWTGEVMSLHLVEQFHGGNMLASWLSGFQVLTSIMGWWTIIFEVAFPFLIWFRKTNPWVLVLGFGFHIGLLALMQVGPFGFVSACAYPVLLCPEVARDWHARFVAWRSGTPAVPRAG